MFDLEQSISEWRKQMLAVGIKTPAPLEELEVHLREEIGLQIKRGLTPAEAFEIAAKKIGSARELKNEFRKTGETFEARLVKLAGIGCGVVALFFSLWTLFVVREAGWAAKLFAVMGTATILLNWKYNYKFLPVIRTPIIRATIGFVCCLACMILMQFFMARLAPFLVARSETSSQLAINRAINQLHDIGLGPRFTGINAPFVLEPTVPQTGRVTPEQSDELAVAVFLWGWTLIALLGGVGLGLEKAAQRSITS
jgi:hypothetical protein